MSSQIEMASLDERVSRGHQYRKFVEIFDFEAISGELFTAEKSVAYKGYGVLHSFKCLLLQFGVVAG